MAINRLNVGLTGVQPGGLAKVIPSSVAVGSGSGSVDSNGTVTFSGASSVALNSIFNANYSHYKVILSYNPSTTLGIQLRYRTGTTDNTTSNYRSKAIYLSGSSTVTGAYGGTDSVNYLTSINPDANERVDISLDFYNPFETLTTHFNGQFAISNNRFGISSGDFNTTTSFDGFNLIPSTGNITGTAQVYGYKN